MTDELIARFFRKECTAPEAAEVSQYLREHPDLLDKYLRAEEWFGAETQPMPAEFWRDNWTEITARRRSSAKVIWLKRAAVAAAFLISAGLAYKNVYVKEKQAPLASVEKPAAPISNKKITINNSAEMMHVTLPDSSSVLLSPGSVITYTLPLDKDKRNIILDGEARFKVMKNEHMPFTVFAGGLATTALGTEFTINTKNNISVKLHSGKVMIMATGEAAKHWTKKVILQPGQQLNYNITEMTAEVGPIKIKNVLAHNNIKPFGKLVAPEEPALNFVNTSLPDVMNRLKDYYHETIIFDSVALDDMNFTGTISRNDSLRVVLKVIAQMNGLELKRDDSGYELKKQQNNLQQ